MKSEWRVTSNFINGKKVYAVYRLLDIKAVDHSGNREYAGNYVEDRKACEAAAYALNKMEEEKR